jgi:predicted ABC-type sugar transport system permease subunit
MKKYIVIIAALLAAPAYANVAYLVEEVTTGNTKQCIYEWAGSKYVITIPYYKLCKITIDV